jgi:protein-arginine kinase activator protein McsA
MSNRDFARRFENLLKEIFGDIGKPNSPMGSFFDNIKYDSLKDDMADIRKTVRDGKDGIVTTIYYVFNENDKGKWSAPKNNRIIDLEKQLDTCIKNQEFEKAVELRDKIKNLKTNSNQIENLKKEMDIAIKEQNFERAIEIRDELKNIN